MESNHIPELVQLYKSPQLLPVGKTGASDGVGFGLLQVALLVVNVIDWNAQLEAVQSKVTNMQGSVSVLQK